MSISKHSKVLQRTLHGSSENPPSFFGEPYNVLQRTLQGSQTNIGGSKNRHRNIILCRVKLIDNYNRYLI